jgi:hypothetical protein
VWRSVGELVELTDAVRLGWLGDTSLNANTSDTMLAEGLG